MYESLSCCLYKKTDVTCDVTAVPGRRTWAAGYGCRSDISQRCSSELLDSLPVIRPDGGRLAPRRPPSSPAASTHRPAETQRLKHNLLRNSNNLRDFYSYRQIICWTALCFYFNVFCGLKIIMCKSQCAVLILYIWTKHNKKECKK